MTSLALQLVAAEDVIVEFEGRRRLSAQGRGTSTGLRAVNRVTLRIAKSEIVGLVGESGAGKTTLAKAILRLLEPKSGRITFDGRDITHIRGRSLREMRREMQMVFQEPHGSLSPRLTVKETVEEPYRIHDIPREGRRDAGELLASVDLPADLLHRFPHEISGGQARRVGIARALALAPRLVVADEPTSGLDVSAAASVLNLISALRDEVGLAYLIVTHDLAVAGYLADRIAVMYLGEIVEVGPARLVFEQPLHPYTQLLLSARPEMGDTSSVVDDVATLSGEMPSPRDPPPGCRFHTRCQFAVDLCREVTPPIEITTSGREVACHRWREISDPGPKVPK